MSGRFLLRRTRGSVLLGNSCLGACMFRIHVCFVFFSVNFSGGVISPFFPYFGFAWPARRSFASVPVYSMYLILRRFQFPPQLLNWCFEYSDPVYVRFCRIPYKTTLAYLPLVRSFVCQSILMGLPTALANLKSAFVWKYSMVGCFLATGCGFFHDEFRCL
ncbi:hypothetical protein ACP275_06G127100 [Erythranthe tilingii]